jgi:hypothetical protein
LLRQLRERVGPKLGDQHRGAKTQLLICRGKQGQKFRLRGLGLVAVVLQMAKRLAAKLVVVLLPQACAALVDGRAFKDLSVNRAGMQQHAARDGRHDDYWESDNSLQRHGTPLSI